jgi:glycosyltransferase involved in cell wall biosynthesis
MPVTLVRTAGSGSMDRYGAALAARLPVPDVAVDLSATNAGAWGPDVGLGGALRRLGGDARLLRALRATRGVPHLASHHLARYAVGLGRPYVATAHDVIRLLDARDGAGHISRPTRRDRIGIALDYEGIRRASAVVTPSVATRDALVERLRIDPARITVVPLGVDHARFRPVAARVVAGPYVLFVGSEHPRKQLPVLLRAFAGLKATGAFPRLRLVKVGAPGADDAPFRAPVAAAVRALALERDVVFAGEVPDDDLPAYYCGALCLAFASAAEGFGLPLLEAMACGCPIVASTAGALPEVAGGAAVTVPAGDAARLEGALAVLAGDPAARARLRSRGLARARAFSWERTARETLAVYEGLA